MRFDVLTLFPQMFGEILSTSILGRARFKGLLDVHLHDIRNAATDKHRTVDDKPYGGGVGMVMMVEPIVKTLAAVTKIKNHRILLLSAKGKPLQQAIVRRYAKLDQLILICGRYEGVDERVKKFVDDEISIGPYVLTGGELPGLTVIDAVTRLLPGVLGKDESSSDESYSIGFEKEYPHYTRPEIFVWEGRNYRVPATLRSGHHEHIATWRKQHRKK